MPAVADETSPALTLTRAALAPPPRTLVDIFRQTVADHPDALAIDNGAEMLTYEEFGEAADELADVAERHGRRSGRPGRHPHQVRHRRPLRRDHGRPRRRGRLRPGRRGRSRRARPARLRRGRSRCGGRQRPGHRRPRPATAAPGTTWTRGRGTTRGSSSRRARRGLRRASRSRTGRRPRSWTPSRGCSCSANRSVPTDRVMAGLSVAFDASCEEMWLAWAHGGCLVPAPRSLVRSGVDVGPWLVANDVTVVSTVPTLVALWPTRVAGRRTPADHGWRGLSARDRHPARPTGPRAVEHLRARPRRRSSRAAPSSTGTARSGSACPSTAGTWPSSTSTASTCGPGRSAS